MHIGISAYFPSLMLLYGHFCALFVYKKASDESENVFKTINILDHLKIGMGEWKTIEGKAWSFKYQNEDAFCSAVKYPHQTE